MYILISLIVYWIIARKIACCCKDDIGVIERGSVELYVRNVMKYFIMYEVLLCYMVLYKVSLAMLLFFFSFFKPCLLHE